MNPIIDLGFISIHWYSVLIFLGVLIGGFLVLKEAKKFGFDEDFMINLIFFTVIIGIVGARLYFVIFNLDYYLSHPLEILMIWKGGLAIHGGILFALIFLVIYLYKKIGKSYVL